MLRRAVGVGGVGRGVVGRGLSSGLVESGVAGALREGLREAGEFVGAKEPASIGAWVGVQGAEAAQQAQQAAIGGAHPLWFASQAPSARFHHVRFREFEKYEVWRCSDAVDSPASRRLLVDLVAETRSELGAALLLSADRLFPESQRRAQRLREHLELGGLEAPEELLELERGCGSRASGHDGGALVASDDASWLVEAVERAMAAVSPAVPQYGEKDSEAGISAESRSVGVEKSAAERVQWRREFVERCWRVEALRMVVVDARATSEEAARRLGVLGSNPHEDKLASGRSGLADGMGEEGLEHSVNARLAGEREAEEDALGMRDAEEVERRVREGVSMPLHSLPTELSSDAPAWLKQSAVDLERNPALTPAVRSAMLQQMQLVASKLRGGNVQEIEDAMQELDQILNGRDETSHQARSRARRLLAERRGDVTPLTRVIKEGAPLTGAPVPPYSPTSPTTSSSATSSTSSTPTTTTTPAVEYEFDSDSDEEEEDDERGAMGEGGGGGEGGEGEVGPSDPGYIFLRPQADFPHAAWTDEEYKWALQEAWKLPEAEKDPHAQPWNANLGTLWRQDPTGASAAHLFRENHVAKDLHSDPHPDAARPIRDVEQLQERPQAQARAASIAAAYARLANITERS